MWDRYLKFPCHIYLDLKWSICSGKLTRNSQSRDSHTFMAPKFFSSAREHHAKIQFQTCLPTLTRQVELAIVFFGLSNAIDNPSPLIVIEANQSTTHRLSSLSRLFFSYQKVNTCIITRPSAEPMCSTRLFG